MARSRLGAGIALPRVSRLAEKQLNAPSENGRMLQGHEARANPRFAWVALANVRFAAVAQHTAKRCRISSETECKIRRM